VIREPLRALAPLLLVLALPAFAEDFSGKWMLYVNGYDGTEFHIFQTGNQLHGWVRAQGTPAVDNTVTGSVSGREINWQRNGLGLTTPQRYHGFLFQLQGNGMAGLYSHMDRTEYAWYALRVGKAEQPPATAPAAAPAGGWQSAGTGDCPGGDVANSKGPAPDPGKCNAQFAGYTAVCWAGECTYKNIAAASCKGGASPGRMYSCSAAAAAAPPPPASIMGWQSAGTGDCPGGDVANSKGPAPDPGKCNAQFAGYTAVCWAGECTYKNIAAGSCKGGASPGRMFTCRASR
jgi:hypothetical protein